MSNKDSENKRLLEVRESGKRRKPDFVRQESKRMIRLKRSGWRKPKGLHSKMRHKFRGRPAMPEQGYRSPRPVRGLDSNGLKPTRVFTVDDLKGLDPKHHSIILPRTLGLRKRVRVVEEAQKLNFNFFNIKDTQAFLSEASKRISERHKRREELEKEKVEKEKKVSIEEKLEEKKEVKKEEVEIDEEERKKEEKREIDKVLTKKTV